MRTLWAAVADRKGVTAAEYAILAVGIVIIVGSAVVAFGPTLSTAFQAVSTQIGTTQSSISR